MRVSSISLTPHNFLVASIFYSHIPHPTHTRTHSLYVYISLYGDLNFSYILIAAFFGILAFYRPLFIRRYASFITYTNTRVRLYDGVQFLSRNESVFNFVELTSQWISFSLFLSFFQYALPFDIRHVQLARPRRIYFLSPPRRSYMNRLNSIKHRRFENCFQNYISNRIDPFGVSTSIIEPRFILDFI